MEQVAIIILNWNGLELTTRCINSLLQQHVPADVFILDNGSARNEAIELKHRFPQITVERSETNLGFTGGNNYWLNRLQHQYHYIVLLNQDTIFTADAITPLKQVMDADARLAACGPTGGTISFWTGKVTSNQGTDCIIGYCMMLRSTVLQQIGLLTNEYFAYYEEADWCVRARQHGYRCQVVDNSTIQHDRKHGFRTYYIARNMVWFVRRYANPLQLSFFFCYYFTIFWIERLRKGSKLIDLWRAARDGWLQRLPKSFNA